MAKEKSINPAQAQRKLEKQKALKKGKAELLARRTERLAHRNPERLQRQADEFRSLEAAGQTLNSRDKKALEELDRDIKAIRKARETLGDKAPPSGAAGGARGGGDRGRGRGDLRAGRGGRDAGILGKRRRDGASEESEEDSATDSVKGIAMPRDTPPPIPEDVRRRLEFGKRRGRNGQMNPNLEPLPQRNLRLPNRPDFENELQQENEAQGEGEGRIESKPRIQTTYEAKPMIRDLRKEAVSAFMPSVVRQKIDAQKGKGGKLLEPEELERLEAEGYGAQRRLEKEPESLAPGASIDGEDEEDAALRELEEEERRFEVELRAEEQNEEREPHLGKTVQIEDVGEED